MQSGKKGAGIAGATGGIVGLVGDILNPLGPINGLLAGAAAIGCCLFGSFVWRRHRAGEFKPQRLLPERSFVISLSLLLALGLWGVVGLMASEDSQGALASNIDAIKQLQRSILDLKQDVAAVKRDTESIRDDTSKIKQSSQQTKETISEVDAKIDQLSLDIREGIDATKPDSQDTKLLGLKSPRLTVEYFRVDSTGVPTRLGRLGTGRHQPIKLNDVVRLSLELDQPQYVLLVAFNPDGSVQLCFPEDETAAPALIEQLEYPAEIDLYFGLTDGSGQQAFLAFVSEDPLPPFADLRKDFEAAGWTTNTTGGIWRFDGSKVSQVFSDKTDRGAVQRLTTSKFKSLCTSFVKQPSMGRVFGFAFPVE